MKYGWAVQLQRGMSFAKIHHHHTMHCYQKSYHIILNGAAHLNVFFGFLKVKEKHQLEKCGINRSIRGTNSSEKAASDIFDKTCLSCYLCLPSYVKHENRSNGKTEEVDLTLLIVWLSIVNNSNSSCFLVMRFFPHDQHWQSFCVCREGVLSSRYAGSQ